MKALVDKIARMNCFMDTPMKFEGRAEDYPLGVCLKSKNVPQCLIDAGCNGKFLGGVLHKKTTAECVVFGHGWDDTADEMFVWTGTEDELYQHWQID